MTNKFKVGDLVFDRPEGFKWLHKVQEGDAQFSDWVLATPADLASMGLVRIEDVNAFVHLAVSNLLTLQECMRPDCIFDKPEPAKPQPVFEVGDKVKIVRSTPWRGMETGTVCVGGTGIVSEIVKDKTSDSEIEVSLDKTINGFTIAGVMHDDLELISKAEKPQPHVWKVGDFAQCPDGKVRRLTHAPFYCFHDLYECDIRDCTPVPRPEMPELPTASWELYDDGRLSTSSTSISMSLDAWIKAVETDTKAWSCDVLPKLLALSEWRKLTGRDM